MVSLRPTPVQAIGRGAYDGVLAGVGGSLVALAAIWLLADPVGPLGWAAAFSPLPVGGAVGAALGLAFGREKGTDIDDVGIRSVPSKGHAYAHWPRIEDLRTERHGGRIHVAVYLDDGRTVRLRAPYNGRLLAGDPEFEHKLFMLRHLWETHRHAREP